MQDCYKYASYIRQEGCSLHSCLYWGAKGIPAEGFNVVFKKMVLNLLTLRTPFSAARPPGRANWKARRYKGDSKGIASEDLQGTMCIYVSILINFVDIQSSKNSSAHTGQLILHSYAQ